MLVDVHAHLTHEAFARAMLTKSLPALALPGSRLLLSMALNRYLTVRFWSWRVAFPLSNQPSASTRWYLNGMLPDLPFPVERFDVDQEIAFIAAAAASGQIIAIGECGLDGHWVGPDCFAEERVFVRLIEVALQNDLPLIIHTRKREARAMEILAYHGVTRVSPHSPPMERTRIYC